jgi:sugar (pentulose or hexulose) kinase
MDILTADEGVVVDEVRGHGGLFKGGDTAQRMLAAALDVPVSIAPTAGEGGAWGMAVLAAFMLRPDVGQTLADYLDDRIGGRIGQAIQPDPRDVQGFDAFYERHARGLAIERAAIDAMP